MKNSKRTNSKRNTSNSNTAKKTTLKQLVMQETIYLLKRNKKHGIRYGEIIKSVMNKYRVGTKNSIHGCIQKEATKENGILKNLVTVQSGIWKLKSAIFLFL
ncbi:MAG: hypothetical protein PHN88_09065 [Ignavibacteria bacterium]|nr:hypothetical protein [Ignavibacteria bacterium]